MNTSDNARVSGWTVFAGRSALVALVALVAVGCGPGVGDDEPGSGSGGSAALDGSTSAGSSSMSHGEEGDGAEDDGAVDDTTAGSSEEGGGTTDAACFESWTDPVAIVEATTRPARSPGMRLNFDYTPGVVTLTDIIEEQVVLPSDGPFDPDEVAGSWAELRDANDEVVYTQLAFQLIPESVEVAGAGQAIVCPDRGGLNLSNMSNDPAATQVVFFQEALDGELTSETIELLRFDLPPI